MQRRRREDRQDPQRRSFADKIRTLGAIAHFDPTFRATDDGTASTWVDRINGYTLASTSTATRLVYSAALAGLNNKPGWTGSAANLTKLTTSDSVLADLLEGTTSYSIYYVRKASTVAAGGVVVSWGSSSSPIYAYHGYNATTGAAVSVRRNGTTDSRTSTVQPGTNLAIESHTYDGASMSVRTNGTDGGSTASVLSLTTDRFWVGALILSGTTNGPTTGDIGDVIVFPTAHALATRQYIEALLTVKYS